MRDSMTIGASRSPRVGRPRLGVVRWVALLMGLLLLSAACVDNRQAGQNEPTELVWAIGSWGDKADPTTELVSLWNEQHPLGPKVRVVHLGQSADDQRQQMATELTAGLFGFDILTLDVAWTGEFAANGWLADLQSKRSEIERESSPAPFRSATWNDRLWAAPFTTNVGLLYYRKDLVRRDFETHPPKTWNELSRIASDAVGKTGTPDLAAFVGQGWQYEGMVVNYMEYLWGAGGDLFNPPGTKVDFAEKPALEALEFMAKSQGNDFYADGFETMTEGEALERFRSGRAVFMRNWTPDYEPLTRAERGNEVSGTFGVVALPSLDGTGTTPAIGGQNLAVSRFSRNVEKAKEFVAFASTTRDVQMDLARNSWAPTMASIYDDPAFADNRLMKLLGEVLPGARARPSTPEWAAISAEIQQNVYPAYTGHMKNRKDAVDAIRSFLERTLSNR